MKNMLSWILVVAMLPLGGCATMKNTKIPAAYNEVGYCKGCKRLMALDGLQDAATCSCPNCGREFVAGKAKADFKKKCVDKKNMKAAVGCLSAAMVAASIAGSIYGIPIPPPPVSEETFAPYELPMVIECKQAAPVGAGQAPSQEPELVKEDIQGR